MTSLPTRVSIPSEEDEFGMKGINDEIIKMDDFMMSTHEERIIRITSPRFWEMRRLLVEFRQRRLFFDDIKEGDFVILPDVMRQRDQPWICAGFKGWTMILANMVGQTLELHKMDAPLLLEVVSKME